MNDGARTRKVLVQIALASLLVSSVLSCRSGNPVHFQQRTRLEMTAMQINDDLAAIRRLTTVFAAMVQEVLHNQKHLSGGLNGTRYALHKNTALYKPEDDGGSALFASGYKPIDEKLKERIRASEYLDLFMKPLIARNPEVAQVYYNDRNSIGRMYPFFDVLAVFEPKIDVTQYAFYYLATERFNPERKAVWVKEPYLDPAGRGWIISSIAPVYENDRLQGVAGMDITISTLIERYFKTTNPIYAIVDQNGLVVATVSQGARILQLPPLVNHKYLETIRSDHFRSEEFNLLKSTNKAIRAVAQKIVHTGAAEARLSSDGETYTVLATPLPEIDWTLWNFIPQ